MTTLSRPTGRQYTDRAEWLAARRQGIGASDASAILGYNPWRSPLQAYLEKIGELPESEESWPMRFGSILEPALSAEYTRRYGMKLTEQLFLKHPEHYWMYATLDAIAPDGTLVEFKTANGRKQAEWGEEETDEVPPHYLIQVQHQMAVADAKLAYIFVSIGGESPKRYRVERHEGLIISLIDNEADFWQRVCDRSGVPSNLLERNDYRYMHHLHPEGGGQITLGDDTASIVNRRSEIAGERKALEEEDAKLKTQLLDAIGPFQSAALPDGRTLTRKVVTVEPQTIERSGYTFTDLRVRKARAG